MFIWKWWWNILISTTQHKRMSFKITDFSPSFSSFTEFLHPLFLHAIPSGQTFVVLTWHYQMFVITCRDWTSRIFNRLFRFPRRDDESRYLEWRCLEWRKGFPWLPSRVFTSGHGFCLCFLSSLNLLRKKKLYFSWMIKNYHDYLSRLDLFCCHRLFMTSCELSLSWQDFSSEQPTEQWG